MNISEMSLNDLKAIVYDNLANIEASQRTIQTVNNEIMNRRRPELVKNGSTEVMTSVLGTDTP